jgi:hypothetical protein
MAYFAIRGTIPFPSAYRSIMTTSPLVLFHCMAGEAWPKLASGKGGGMITHKHNF